MPKHNSAGADGHGPSDAMITKVGAAFGQVVTIQKTYSSRIAAAPNDGAKHDLQEEATAAAVQAISNQGITVAQYNDVVSAAQADPDLEERLLEAANFM
jgi:hypothetical protein